MNKQQLKINLEQLKIKILTQIWRNPMANYTADTIAMLNKTTERQILTVLTELINCQMLHRFKGTYQVTDAGLEYARVSQTSPKMPVNTKQWKNEALMGLTTKQCGQFIVSEQSAIKRAVIPKGC